MMYAQNTLLNQQWGHYKEISDQCLRFPCNDQMDEVNKLFIILYGLSILDLSLQSILKVTTGQRIIKKKMHINELFT